MLYLKNSRPILRLESIDLWREKKSFIFADLRGFLQNYDPAGDLLSLKKYISVYHNAFYTFKLPTVEIIMLEAISIKYSALKSLQRFFGGN